MQRGRMRGKACRNNRLVHGDYGIQALEPVWLTSRQIVRLDEQFHVIRRDLENYGLKFFLINLLQHELKNHEWVLVKGPLNIG